MGVQQQRRCLPVALIAFAVACFLCPATRAAEPPSAPRYGIQLEETRIPMPDGVRLAADLYMPDGATKGERFPVLLEYLPYRKRGASSGR